MGFAMWRKFCLTNMVRVQNFSVSRVNRSLHIFHITSNAMLLFPQTNLT